MLKLPRRLLAASLFLPFLLSCLMLLVCAPARAAIPGLTLEDHRSRIDAWPVVTALDDEGGKLTVDAALAAKERFKKPDSAYATLGKHADIVWLRIPVTVAPTSDGDWVLDIDYAVLHNMDLFVMRGDVLTRHAVAGNLLPSGSKQTRTRTPAVSLRLDPGKQYELLLRLEHRGPLILPIRLSKPNAYHAASLNEQMLQGILLGLSLCLLLYSLAQWINLREPLFGKYAMLVGGTTLFSVSFFGLGDQYLWPNNSWMTLHSGGLFSLMASCGAYLFVEQALARAGQDRIFSRLMKGCALLTVVSAIAYATDAIGVQALVAIVSTLGLLPMLLGLPGAYLRARSGDAVGIYFLIGWAVSFLASVILSQVIGGKVGANFWTMHALQFGSIFDMLVFMRILGLRTKAMQSSMLRAEAATRMKSDFLANMSHEIRTPMNAIIGMSRLALMNEPSPSLRNYLGKILGAGEHLLGIINDILDFSKIEAGKLSLESVPFDLDEMLEHLASLTAIKTDAKLVELVFRVANGVPARLVGDPLRLGQILINLTSNAVKFTERGEIVVAVDIVDRSADSVNLRFSVTDTGIGMDSEQLGRLFQSFSQADGSITRKYGGTGLGLSISKQLAELMGGSIEVSSKPGAGSRFSFTVRQGIGDPGAATLASPAAALQQVRVIVVDDSTTARDALLEMLGSFGIIADAAASGEESLGMLVRAEQAGEPYQIVLMDYLMPGWDGVETIRRIQSDARFQAPPAILMVTACTRETVQRQQGQLPLDGFLTKPVGPALLYHSLLQVLRPELAGSNPAGMRAVPRARDLARLDGARVLLVDDNANNREVAIDFMAPAHMQVDVALHGGEAVAMVQKTDYDLVLMDIQMHEVDGFTATRRIRALPGLQNLPIIAMTAHAMAGDREQSLAAGMNDHVTKPIDPELLFRVLLKWVDPVRLAGRKLPAVAPPPPVSPIAAPPQTHAPLPPIQGVDWQQALASVNHQRGRLQKRVRGFLLEYQDAPPAMREALSSGRHAPLQNLAHNLKASASYVGAHELSGLANALEQALRTSVQGQIARLAPAMIASLETVLAGLAAMLAQEDGAASASTSPGAAVPVSTPGAASEAARIDLAEAARLIRQLGTHLRGDDARAEDVLLELQQLLGTGEYADQLGAIAQAVDDIEYHAALAPLASLAQALDMKLEESA